MTAILLVAAAVVVALQLTLLRAVVRVEKHMISAEQQATIDQEAADLAQLKKTLGDKDAAIAALQSTNGKLLDANTALTKQVADINTATSEMAQQIKDLQAAGDRVEFDAAMVSMAAELHALAAVPAAAPVDPVVTIDPTPVPVADPTPSPAAPTDLTPPAAS